MANIAPLLLIAGAVAFAMSKKKKSNPPASTGFESQPSVPEDGDTRATSNAQKCNEFLSQLYVEANAADELPILAIAVEEQIVPFLEDEIDKAIEEIGGPIDVNHAPEFAIDVLNHISPPCNWQHEFAGDWHLVYPNDERAKKIYNATIKLATQIALDANEKASGKGLSQGNEPKQAGISKKG